MCDPAENVTGRSLIIPIDKVSGRFETCAIAMALGTSAGSYRIIRLEPVNGFAAETAAATVICAASQFGMPVSTTHVISGRIFGVSASKRFSVLRWGVAQTMVVAWILTIPASAFISGLTYKLITAAGIH